MLVTVPDLEIVEAGMEYPVSTGMATFTREDLADAVKAANEDPAVKAPRLKLGHISPLNAEIQAEDQGQPALGTVQNLRLNDTGSKIIGDYVGVPSWLAAILPSAYPSRSFEGNYNHKTSTDRTYRLVIKAVALLGVRWPGCSTVEDIKALYGDDMPEGVEIAAAEGGNRVSANLQIAASVNVDDIRRQFYDGPGDCDCFMWVQAVYVDPYEIIVMNESDESLERYSYSCSPDGEVTFGEPEPVIVQYVPNPLAASEKMATIQCAGRQVVVYASRSESRPDKSDPQGGQSMSPEELRASIGLPAEATDDEVRAKLVELQKPAAGTEGEPAPTGEPSGEAGQGASGGSPAAAPAQTGTGSPAPVESESEPLAAADGMVSVPAEVWRDVQAGAQRGNTVYEEQLLADREESITKACEKGRIAASQKEQFIKLWDKDPKGTKNLLCASVEQGGLADNLVPVTARGTNQGAEDEIAAAEAYPTDWLSGPERERIAALQGRG